jgi:hypothetical protein
MFGIETLDVMIGIITVYLIFALACTAIVEAWSSWREVRSRNLEVALGEFLHGDIEAGKDFAKAFFAHPLVLSLSKGDEGRPSYISPKLFGRVVESLIMRKGAPELVQAIASLPEAIHITDNMGKKITVPNRIKGLLGALLAEARNDALIFRNLLEDHYDAAMDRASGWYKRHTQRTAIIVSALLVVFANVDTINLANSLSANPAARAKMIEIAQQQLDGATAAAVTTGKQNTEENKPAASAIKPGTPAANPDRQDPPDPVKEATDRSEKAAAALAKAHEDLSSAGIQLGWKGAYPSTGAGILSKALGLLVSLLAISLGAPFWFDMLSRIMRVRAAGISPRDAQKKPA